MPSLDKILEVFLPHAKALLLDEMGDETEAICESLIDRFDSDEADWLSENWDIVLTFLRYPEALVA